MSQSFDIGSTLVFILKNGKILIFFFMIIFLHFIKKNLGHISKF